MGDRKVEVLVVEDGTWVVVPFKDLCKGNIFKLYEDDDMNELYIDENGDSVFVALDDAFYKEDRWGIKCEVERRFK